MTAAYFEDHPTDPDKVILRKPYSTDCPNCEYHRQRAQLWRDEAYKQAGHPLPERDEPWSPVSIGVDITKEGAHVVGIYALNKDTSQVFYAKHHPAPQRTWVGLTDEETIAIELGLRIPTGYRDAYDLSLHDFARAIEAKLKEKNT
jgi:hypothetical protein